MTGRLWHVVVTVAGESVPAAPLHHALHQLCTFDPGNLGIIYRSDLAELHYWDEGDRPSDVAAAGASMWDDSRQDLQLPPWRVVGLEVLDKERLRGRLRTTLSPVAPGSVTRLG